MSASRPRNFRADLPLTRKSGPLKVHTEDAALTRYLVRALKEARSPSLKPPACPYCCSRLTILAGRPHARMPMPAFQCNSCSRQFNRLTGTSNLTNSKSLSACRSRASGGHRCTSAVLPVPNPEVAATARRRQFSSSEKRRILAEADRCTEPGEIGVALAPRGHLFLQSHRLADPRPPSR
jgi:hypothetical protein